jgi:hypothetical protein
MPTDTTPLCASSKTKPHLNPMKIQLLLWLLLAAVPGFAQSSGGNRSSGTGGAPAWNAVTSATGNQTLANTTFNTTISNTSSANFIVHSNATAATSLGVNQSSPFFNECGNYFTLGASAQDCWNFQDVLTAGTKSSTVTNVSESAGNVVTLTITGGTLVAGQIATFTGLTTATWLNSQNATLTTASATSLTFADPTSHGTQTSAAETGQVTQANPLSAFTLSHVGSGNGASQVMYQHGQATFTDGTTYPTANIGQLTVPGRICGITNSGNYPPGVNYGFAMEDICPTVFTVAAPTASGTASQSIAIVNAAMATQIPTHNNQFLFNGQIATPSGYAGNLLGSTYGIYHETDHNGSGTLTQSFGAFFATYNSGNGTISDNRALYAEAVNDFYNTGTTGTISANYAARFKSGAITGTNTNDYTLNIMSPYTGGTFSNGHIGIQIDDQSAGGTVSATGIRMFPASGATPTGYTGLDIGVNTIGGESTGTGFFIIKAPTGTFGSQQFNWPTVSGYFTTSNCATGKVFLNNDFTSANASGLQAITGLNCVLPGTGLAINSSFTCSIMYSQATNVAGDQFGVGYTGGVTNFNAWANVATNTGAATPFTTAAVTGIVSNTPTSVVTFQPGNTGLNVADIHGTIESANNGTFQLYVTNGTAADVIVVKRSSYCQFF